MEINLNKAHRLIHQLEKETQPNSSWDQSTMNIVTEISILKLQLSKDKLNDILSDPLNDYINLCSDYVLLKSKLLEANVSCKLHKIIANIELLNKQIKVLSEIRFSNSVLSIEDINNLDTLLGSSNILDVVEVSLWDKSKLDNLILEYKQKLNSLLNQRDLLNNSQTIDISELSNYSKKLLGL